MLSNVWLMFPPPLEKALIRVLVLGSTRSSFRSFNKTYSQVSSKCRVILHHSTCAGDLRRPPRLYSLTSLFRSVAKALYSPIVKSESFMSNLSNTKRTLILKLSMSGVNSQKAFTLPVNAKYDLIWHQKVWQPKKVQICNLLVMYPNRGKYPTCCFLHLLDDYLSILIG